MASWTRTASKVRPSRIVRMSPRRCRHSGLSRPETASMSSEMSTSVRLNSSFRYMATWPPPLPRSSTSCTGTSADGLPDGDRWSTWDHSPPTDRGPRPYPDWLVTDLGATDTELGILKTGKEADVFLLRRGVPETDRSCLVAAKRYRAAEHRLFHRDIEYTDGRRVRESRDNRAMARRTATGRAMIAQQWARAEFSALGRLHQAGLPVPYPVQVTGTVLPLAFIVSHVCTAVPMPAE